MVQVRSVTPGVPGGVLHSSLYRHLLLLTTHAAGAWRRETDKTGLYFKAHTQTHKEIHIEKKVMNIMNRLQ